MSNSSRRNSAAIWFAAGAAVLLIASLWLPLWRMRMEAPQYRDEEALKVIVYPNALRGDLNEIRVLNRYIGVHIPNELPQLKWLPVVLFGAAGLGIGATFLPGNSRFYALVFVPTVLGLVLLGAALQAQWQMYQIGHRRDAKTTLVGVKDFTTPLLGTRKIAQFEVSSRLGIGAYLVGAAVALQFVSAWVTGRGCGVSPRNAGNNFRSSTCDVRTARPYASLHEIR